MGQIASPPLNGANRFAHIDAMRAFAVMLVVVAHAGLGHIVPGGSGVTIFFSISGFIITYLLLRERDKSGSFSAKGFYFRRAVKIAPPFFLVIVLPSIVSSFWERLDMSAFIGQLLFVYNWIYIDGKAVVLNGSDVVWSLSIEEQFYIVFALIWLAAVRVPRWRAILTAVAAIAIVYSTVSRIVMASDSALGDRIYYGSDTRLDGIAWGVLAAIGFHWWQSKGSAITKTVRFLASDGVFVGAVCVYVFSLVYRDEWFRDTFRYSLQSLAACCIIIYGLLPGVGPVRKVLYSVSQWKLVSLIGLASYSIYLVHLVLMNAVRDSLDFGLPLSVIVLSLIGLLPGMVIYRFVEVPAQSWGHRARLKRNLVATAQR